MTFKKSVICTLICFLTDTQLIDDDDDGNNNNNKNKFEYSCYSA